ncbi:alpha/beta hydrolase family protein [Thermomonas flagellata]|uniref:alpha/beta hydrolase family protein n=1 Tax=Thermomonas flagellata TaxID=2888524 RepID=UPI001F04C28A|nr:alpha/beta fold hydrolase [Thermomonas flagellata]
MAEGEGLLTVTSADGHRADLLLRLPPAPRAALLWLPALGVSARHYLPFAEALAARGVAVFLHEWRGHGSSTWRAGRDCDWGYRTLLTDIAASRAALETALPADAATQPRVLGGHSLGGQLAGCHLALQPGAAQALWLVASGAPYWRVFPRPRRWLLPLAYRFLPWLADRVGHLPGRRIGFAGNEARGVIHDWARSGLSGRYAAAGLEADLEAGMARWRGRACGLVLADDWLGPPSSLAYLLGKLVQAECHAGVLSARQLGTRADHYAWMRQPQAVVEALLADGLPG